jgi:hypothetical protein
VDTISSLRPPGVGEGPTQQVSVEVTTLDDFAVGHAVAMIDLIKLDVEGGELEVLAGALRVIQYLRPLWLFEPLDATAAAWQRSGQELIERFRALDHEVFELTAEGWLQRHVTQETYPNISTCNFLAVPRARLAQVAALRVSVGGMDAGR